MTSLKNSRDQACGFMNVIYTFIIFSLTVTTLSFSGVFYFVVNLVRGFWLNYLEKRFPDLEFVQNATIRSVVETHRNMGIITLLVAVKGNSDPTLIKKRLIKDILEKKQNNGQYVYKHLRKTLTTRWGWYAWQKSKNFNIDNHLIFASSYYRGRAISDANIQECVSETVSKYLIPDLPPWQITVFQLLTSDKYYMLIRFHHMLLSQEGMDLGSLFIFSEKPSEIIEGEANKEENFNNYYGDNDDKKNKSLFSTNVKSRRTHPFQELYKTPKTVPFLIKKSQEMMERIWNDFLNSYDPTENPSVLKNPGIIGTLAIFAVLIVAIIKQFLIKRSWNFNIIKNCLAQKGITGSFIFRASSNFLNPISWMIVWLKGVRNILMLFIKLPIIIICELQSFCFVKNEYYNHRFHVKTLLEIWAVIKESIKEAFYYWKLIYNGPKVILEEFLLANKYNSHQLQLAPLCGRKVLSWSSDVPLEKIREIEDVTGASMSEILITATSASLRKFLMQYSLDVPDGLTTTVRYFFQENLLNEISSSCGSGILCLPLPIRNPFEVEYDPVTELRAVQQIILRARLKQPSLYLVSLAQLKYGILTQMLPSPLLRLVLNVLSRRFPVVLNEIVPSENSGNKKYYLWDQEVEDMIYLKPPQANICISLTLMTFGNYVKLGVMADALLSPHHAIITTTFAKHVWELAAAAGVTTQFGNYYFTSDDSDTPEITRSSRNSTLSSSSLEFDLEENNLNQNDSSPPKYPLGKMQFNIPL